MRTIIWLLAIALLAPFALAQSLCTRVTFAAVTDQKTHLPINGLTASDFRATSKQGHIDIVNVARQVPQRALIVLDASGSMDRNTRQIAQQLAWAAPASTEVGLFAFAGRERLKHDFTKDHAAVGAAASVLPWEKGKPDVKTGVGKTPLYDAVHEALTMLSPSKPSDVLFLITDGGDDASKEKVSQLTAEAVSANVRGFAIVVGPAATTQEEREELDFIANLARQTGGIALNLHESLRGIPAFASLVYDHSYRIAVRPSDDREQKWKLTVPGHKVLVHHAPQLQACPAADTSAAK